MLANTAEQKDLFDFLLDKYEAQKLLRISTWITRFINNCRKFKKRGHLATSEIQCQEKFYINENKGRWNTVRNLKREENN